MADQKKTKRAVWGSKIGFILAAAGSAVGLGNLWKFPYITYKFGAGAFVLVYLACIFIIGLPIMLAELLVGRRAKRNPVGAFKKLRPKTAWAVVGGMGVACGFILLAYYSVVAGWALEYSAKSIANDFRNHDTITDDDIRAHLWSKYVKTDVSRSDLVSNGFVHGLSATNPSKLNPKEKMAFREALKTQWAAFAKEKPTKYKKLRKVTADSLWESYRRNRNFSSIKEADQRNLWIGGLFKSFVSNPTKVVLWHLVFMLLTIGVVISGVSGGIERVAKVLMPALFAMLCFLMVKSLSFDGASGAIADIFRPDFGKLSGEAVLEAMGHAFFTLSLGMGAMLTYGSYLDENSSIAKSSLVVTLLDTIIALMATVIIFCSLRAFKMPITDGGIANLFIAIPAVFQKSSGGDFMTIVFYVLVAFAALTSTIALLEVVVSYFVDEKGWSRRKATLLSGGAIALLGIPCALSFNAMSGFKIFGMTVFDLLDYLVANWMLPLGGLLIALFVGWSLTDAETREELSDLPEWLYQTWRVLIRFVSPAAVSAVLGWLIYSKIVG